MFFDFVEFVFFFLLPLPTFFLQHVKSKKERKQFLKCFQREEQKTVLFSYRFVFFSLGF